ncbi:MAG: methylated-DNA--[protein]-cysteine S-methyltransferase [Planctomycetota bacterium]
MTRFIFDSRIGRILVTNDREGLREVRFVGRDVPCESPKGGGECAQVVAQLREYLDGQRRDFDVTMSPVGTPFQLEVWREVAEIPYGTTRTYAEVASRIGRPRAVRAVGAANGRNPISLIVPCHRVLGHDGSLTGYSGGLEAKAWLLELEGVRGRTS